MPGVVPEYVEREAARFGLYRWIDWCQLSITERLYGIAHYRLHALIEMHEGEAMNEHFKRQGARNRNTVGAGTFAGGRPITAGGRG
jgi:hypothetical protein